MSKKKTNDITADKIKAVSNWDYSIYKRAKKTFERQQRKNERRKRRIEKFEEGSISSIIPSAGFAGWLVVVGVVLTLILSLVW